MRTRLAWKACAGRCFNFERGDIVLARFDVGVPCCHLNGTVKNLRISIIGGGIGGLTAALSLQHFGYRVSVFERT